MLVTMPFNMGGLRRKAVDEVVRMSLRAVKSRAKTFRVTAYSLQSTRILLIVEADTEKALVSGLRAVAIRMGKRVNQAVGRTGRIFSDRHSREPVSTPKAMRDAYRDVLLAARLDGKLESGEADPFSSSPWFGGWSKDVLRVSSAPAVSKPETKLGSEEWLRHGKIDPGETPAEIAAS